MTECKKVSRVYVADNSIVTGSCLGVWNSYNKAAAYAKKATALYKQTHPHLTAVVVDGVELITYKAM